ncbi:hypothetical protein PILCRDRAFT_112896 [Piloderma croceum F 1598]|uniref:HNH nuclease domain-containing protein n=1 Tax=Piloderma croceum (strain F 1598) TaxID=765440 RepID=A0A0C3GNR0_PILCF|nr:hypothetical protein PILCRDRAFT_112896 [Piloderma croceum F 1598]
MLDALPQVPIGSKDGAMPDVNRLAAHYLTHLCFAFWNPPGPSTPQVSTHPSPDIPQKVVIKELIRQSTDDHQMSTLKTLVELRDNKLKCPVSSSPFIPAVHGVVSELAHILPFSIHGKSETHKAIEMFTGMDIDAQTIIALVNRPENALLLDHDSHKAFDTMCSWGIEAYVDVNGTNRYFVRPIIPKQIPMHMLGYINREFILGDGIQGIGEEGNRIALPDPRLCNLKLNVMRVMHASGAADVFEEQKKNLLRTSIAQPCNLSFWALQWRWTKSFLTNST